jgi:hypothetical protein
MQCMAEFDHVDVQEYYDSLDRICATDPNEVAGADAAVSAWATTAGAGSAGSAEATGRAGAASVATSVGGATSGVPVPSAKSATDTVTAPLLPVLAGALAAALF